MSQARNKNLQRALNEKIKKEAATRGVSIEHLRHQIAFEGLLDRLYSAPDPGWTLKGATSLLMRNGSGRYTSDMDFSRDQAWSNAEEVKQEFVDICSRKSSDPFTYGVTKVKPHPVGDDTGYATPTMEVRIQVNYGGKEFLTFKIDVTVHRHTQEPTEEILVKPVLSSFTSYAIPEFSIITTPIESHLADKVCAMYERHNQGREASTRTHDLLDILTILQTQEFDFEKLALTLGHEYQRRKMTLPKAMISPGPKWESEYGMSARKNKATAGEYNTLEKALKFAGQCLNPVLARLLQESASSPEEMSVQKTWNPKTCSWQ
ncbi:nucleotidyl transferase AbiEii/AbiGii toxin family protein [Corynebacterium glucuronolyticum]